MMMPRLPWYGRLGSFTFRMCATVLAAQSIVVFFGALVAWQLANAGASHAGPAYLLAGSGVAVLALLAAGLMRSPVGVSLGWVVQVATLLAALVVPAMLLVTVIFGSLWLVSLVQGGRVDAARGAAAPPQ